MTTTQPADTIAAIRERVEKAPPGDWPTADLRRLISCNDEACGIIRGLCEGFATATDMAGGMVQASTFWPQAEKEAVARTLTFLAAQMKGDHAAAQAFLSGTPTDGAQGGED